MPRMGEKMELKATGKKEKLLGFNCEQYEINHGGETMEIYATDKLPPFQPYVRSRLSGFGPRMLQEQWPELLAAMKLFPLRAILRLEDGGERFRLEVKSVKPGQIDKPELFQPPEGYTEILPLPF